jgi:hypothetical protein
MNSDVMPSIVQMDAAVLKNLLTEVKETVATDTIESKPSQNSSTFGIVDMWNMRRTAKSARSLWR